MQKRALKSKDDGLTADSGHGVPRVLSRGSTVSRRGLGVGPRSLGAGPCSRSVGPRGRSIGPLGRSIGSRSGGVSTTGKVDILSNSLAAVCIF